MSNISQLTTKKRPNKERSQQKKRRRETLFIKAYEYCQKCDADIFIILRTKDNGQTFTLSSENSQDGKWPPSQQEIVSLAITLIKPMLIKY
jgi:hypothetical protein